MSLHDEPANQPSRDEPSRRTPMPTLPARYQLAATVSSISSGSRSVAPSEAPVPEPRSVGSVHVRSMLLEETGVALGADGMFGA